MGEESLAVPTYLRDWRKFRGLTQEQLSAAAGVVAASISHLENGNVGFTDKSLAGYAKALRCSAADILAWNPRQPNSFWPLFQRAERLTGRERDQLYAILAAALGPHRNGLE